MDQETREAFDRLDAKIDAQAAELRGGMVTLGTTLRGEIVTLGTQLHAEMVTLREDMLRHFDVAVEIMRGDFAVVAEGLALANQRTDQRFGEQTKRTDRLEGRVLGLEVRVSRLEEGDRPRRARRRP